MRFVDIIYKKNDGVARVTINRPEVYNAKRGRTTDELSEALQDASNDDSLRVVVIAGSGPNAFCSGVDQSEDRTTTAYSGTAKVGADELVRTMSKPVIAMVDGFAIGSGNILAYMCDFTVASTRSTFGQTGPRVGSPATGWGIGYLANVVGQKKAREIWMLTQQYTAQQAFEMGLVNSVVPHEELEAEVDRYCALIKNNSPVILQLEKLTFNEIGEYTKNHRSPADQFIPNYKSSEEAEERRLSFLERRPIDPSKNLPYVKISPGDRP
ncbi:MAG: enoyl-CoA hydratase-related protein [Chloroflexi bacterium]|nr:enoyl-CoA hydratase-related protein [Chloroflexota bacterium]